MALSDKDPLPAEILSQQRKQETGKVSSGMDATQIRWAELGVWQTGR